MASGNQWKDKVSNPYHCVYLAINNKQRTSMENIDMETYDLMHKGRLFVCNNKPYYYIYSKYLSFIYIIILINIINVYFRNIIPYTTCSTLANQQ